MGHRNEPARERRRRYMKQQMSLTSLPLDDRKGRLLTLKNHFGWMVLQKCQVGDGNISSRYPQVVQYHENPEMNGPNYKKVTYVMYLDGKEGDVGKKEKEIQTGPPTGAKEVIFIQPPREAYYPQERSEPREPGEPREPREPRKIYKVEEEPIDDKEERVVVREKKPPQESSNLKTKMKLIGDLHHTDFDKPVSSEKIFRPIESEVYNKPINSPVIVENYTTDYVPSNHNIIPKIEKARSAPKSWQLRAGAENADSDIFTGHRVGEGRDDKDRLKQGFKSEVDAAVNFKYNYKYEGRDTVEKLGRELIIEPDSVVNYYNNYKYEGRNSEDKLAQELTSEVYSAVHHYNCECECSDTEDKLEQKKSSGRVTLEGQMLWDPALRTNDYLYIYKNRASKKLRGRSPES